MTPSRIHRPIHGLLGHLISMYFADNLDTVLILKLLTNVVHGLVVLMLYAPKQLSLSVTADMTTLTLAHGV